MTKRKLGLRKLEWLVEKDEIDHSFKVRINGRDISMFGANWIPADAIPSRITPDVIRDLLESAQAVNMNMLRIWGGGQYEPDYFYELCDELGILIWHDFMFACMSYPSDRAFLADVRTEITQQVPAPAAPRLDRHLVRRQRGDRLAALVPRDQGGTRALCRQLRPAELHALATSSRMRTRAAASGRVPLRSATWTIPTAWHMDTRGDTHYWSVWHEAKDFSAYRDVNPRFASEFGFQSFTSMNVIETFTKPRGSQPDLAGDGGAPAQYRRQFAHSRNDDALLPLPERVREHGVPEPDPAGPRDQDRHRILALDQAALHGHALLADQRHLSGGERTSLDYGGQWKLLHYMAKRFFAPINVVAVPDGDMILLKAINDTAEKAEIALEVQAVDAAGKARVIATAKVEDQPRQGGGGDQAQPLRPRAERVPVLQLDGGRRQAAG